MSGRALRAAGVAGGALALLCGCTFGGGRAHGAATTPALAPSAPPPVGSIEHPRPVECADGMTRRVGSGTGPGQPATGSPGHASPTSPSASSPSRGATSHPGGSTAPSAPSASSPTAKDDVTVGPLTWLNLRALASGDQHTLGNENSGGWHYRITARVTPDAVVTVVVGAQQRARAGLEFGGEYGIAPAPAVAFHGCPVEPTSFPGSFFVAGDGRACVPLDVRVGDGPTRRVVISFFNGRCPA